MTLRIETWTEQELRAALEDAEICAAFVPCTGPDYPEHVAAVRRYVAELRRRGLEASSVFEDEAGAVEVRLLRRLTFTRQG